MNSRKNPEVLVAGAGPVGLFAALRLADKGVRVTIVDKESERAGHSFALGLHARSLQLLEEAGLGRKILEQSRRIRKIGLYEGSDCRAEMDLSVLDQEFPFLSVIRQDQLEGILEDALSRLGVRISWHHRLSELVSRADGVSATVDKLVLDVMGYGVTHSDWVVGRSFKYDVPFVIGADGYLSFVRRSLPIEFESVGETEYFAVFEFKSDADFGEEARIVFANETTNVLWPLPDQHFRWSFQMLDYTAAEDSREKDRSPYEIIGSSGFPALSDEHLHALIEERAPWFTGSIDEIRWRIVVRFERRLADSFGSQQVWLAGDAAHLTGPVGIQSMNVGFREANDLAKIIGGILREGESPDHLENYNRDRIAEWRSLLGLEDGLTPMAGVDPWIQEHKDRLLACLPASGPELSRLAAQLKLKLADVKIKQPAA